MDTADSNYRGFSPRLSSPTTAQPRVNALGYLRAMFTVSDIDETLNRLQRRGATLVGDVVQYEDLYRLCYIRGHEGILIGIAEQLIAGE